MPLYDFGCSNKECENHDKLQEQLVPMSISKLECELCKQDMFRKITSSKNKTPHISWSSWRVGIGLKG